MRATSWKNPSGFHSKFSRIARKLKHLTGTTCFYCNVVLPSKKFTTRKISSSMVTESQQIRTLQLPKLRVKRCEGPSQEKCNPRRLRYSTKFHYLKPHTKFWLGEFSEGTEIRYLQELKDSINRKEKWWRYFNLLSGKFVSFLCSIEKKWELRISRK